jgi:hypothetical protein
MPSISAPTRKPQPPNDTNTTRWLPRLFIIMVVVVRVSSSGPTLLLLFVLVMGLVAASLANCALRFCPPPPILCFPLSHHASGHNVRACQCTCHQLTTIHTPDPPERVGPFMHGGGGQEGRQPATREEVAAVQEKLQRLLLQAKGVLSGWLASPDTAAAYGHSFLLLLLPACACPGVAMVMTNDLVVAPCRAAE